MKQRPLSTSQVLMAVAASGSGLLLAMLIREPIGWLMWLAPVPVLLLALRLGPLPTFLSAFGAWFIGRADTLLFLLMLMPGWLAVLLVMMMSAAYGLVVLGFRQVNQRHGVVMSLLAYPVLMTTVEFLVATLSADGTAASIAYTQSNYLPLVRTAAMGGPWMIIFLVSLVPATLVLALKYRQQQLRLVGIITITAAICFGVFGWERIQRTVTSQNELLHLGLVTAKEELHPIHDADAGRRRVLMEQYARLFRRAADQGADVILFPEKVFTVKEEEKDSLVAVLSTVAEELRTTLIGGITVLGESQRRNIAVMLTAEGGYHEYQKNFHVKVWEDGFVPGGVTGIMEGTRPASGLAICKDLDFPDWIREYALVNVLYVPAWDFEKDGWLHSRMAILRGVENGLLVVRAARQGRLTVSDYNANVLAETDVDDGKEAVMLATVPVDNRITIYSRYGNWLGWACIALTAVLLWLPGRRKER